MKSKSLSAQVSGPLARAEPWARGSPLSLPFTSLPTLHRRIAEIASGTNGASKEAGAGIPESQRYFFPFPPDNTTSRTCFGKWVQTAEATGSRGEKNSSLQCFQLGEGLGGGRSRGEDGRERKVELGEEAVLNSSHLINLHR